MNILLEIAIASAVLPCDSALWQLPEVSFANPAVKQWMLPRSNSLIGAEYANLRFSEPTDVQRGRGEDYWRAGASTYLKHKTSTLWGDASYLNGHQRDVVWNETSDIDLIYPYVTADAKGGDLNMERYRLAGGYADHTDRWAWGATLSYDAGQYFRNVDPRPRNITGLLDISAGAAILATGSHFAGLSLNYRKYKQDSDIDFKSEMGEEKIYHLTGLGNHYSRFAGTGENSYYNGHRIGLTADFYPESNRGFAASAGLSRFSFEKILTDLNKLPLVKVNHDALTLQGSWRAPGRVHDWGAAVTAEAYKRSGTENIFGDPSASIYPQIGSLAMYRDKSVSAAIEGVWQYHPWTDGRLLWVKGSGRYIHRRQAYADPFTEATADKAVITLDGLYTTPFAGAWRATLAAGALVHTPFIRKGCAEFEDCRQTGGNLRIGVQRQINSSLGLLFTVRWDHAVYHGNTSRSTSNRFTLSLSVTL